MSAQADSRVTVLLVDDHAVVREGYRRLLERHGDIVVVGEAGDADSAQALFHSLDPQIVVMDISLPGVSGIEVLRLMLAQRPQTRVLMFSMHEEVIFAKRALQAGAYGYVTKASAPQVLVQAVHALQRGKRYLSATVAEQLALIHASTENGTADSLSVRELEVLRLLVQGQTVRAIAQHMGLNPKTVANHQSAIKSKLGAETPMQLLMKASSCGFKFEH
jgi:DNA-binding NarL/FixJ family response regulator